MINCVHTCVFPMINKTIIFSYTSREPTREWAYEDGEQSEFQQPELEPEDQDEPSVSFSSQHKQIMKNLYELLPHKFRLADQACIPEAHKLFGYNSSTPALLLIRVLQMDRS